MALGFMNNNNQNDNGFCIDANYAVRAAVKVGSSIFPSSPPINYLRPAIANPADSFEIDVSKNSVLL
jgi:hypothetical protein